MNGAAVGRVLAELRHEPGHKFRRDVIDPRIRVAVFREISLNTVVDGESGFVTDDMHLGIFYRGEAVGDDRQAGDAEGHGAQDIAVVERHLQPFIEILVVHVVDAVHRMHVGSREPLHGRVELREDLVIIEYLARDWSRCRCDLLSAYLVPPTIDGVEHRLGEIHARAEELHLLAEAHGRDTTGDRVIVTPIGAHKVVVLILARSRRVATNLDAIKLEGGRQILRPQDSDVRLRSWAEIGQGVQHAVAGARYQRPSVHVHSADAFSRPVRVTAEQRIIIRRAQEAHNAQFLHKLVD